MSEMKGWVVKEYGPYKESMHFEAIEKPKAEGMAALIQIKAAGLNFADLLSVEGKYQSKVPPPFTPGIEAAGVVVETGEDCSLNAGDRVIVMNLAGAFAEYIAMIEHMTFPIPDSMSDEEAAAFLVTYQTAYFALAYRAQLKEGETLLVHAGAGGVGSACIQLGKAMGATVIATAGSEEKLQVCRDCGADHVINYREEDFAKKVKSLTSGNGANVIFDPVGGDVFDKSTKCIAWEGRIVIIGFASGRIPEISANRILLKNIAVTGLFWGNYMMHNPFLVKETHTKLCKLYEEGKIKPVIYKTYALDALPDAFEALGSRKSYGKIVLAPE